MHANQFVAAITQTVGGLPIDIENSQLIVEQKKSVCRVVDKCAETRLARAQLALGLPQLRDVLQDAKLAQRAACLVPCNIALTMNHSDRTVRANDAIFDSYRGPPASAAAEASPRSTGLPGGSARASARANPANRPAWRKSADLVRKRHWPVRKSRFHQPIRAVLAPLKRASRSAAASGERPAVDKIGYQQRRRNEHDEGDYVCRVLIAKRKISGRKK